MMASSHDNNNSATPKLSKRGHKRSVSLENNSPLVYIRTTPQHQHHHSQHQQQMQHQQQQKQLTLYTGTLKSRNEQRYLNHKFGSHNNLQDNAQQGRSKFQNIRQMFELSKSEAHDSTRSEITLQSLPTTLGSTVANPPIATPNTENQQYQQQQQQQQQHMHKITPTLHGSGSTEYHEQQQQQQQQKQQPQDTTNINNNETNEQVNVNNSTNNYLRPISFKPIPFEPDYRIINHHHQHYHHSEAVGDRFGYGSTPSLAPVQSTSLKFGSTTDLRHGGIVGSAVSAAIGVGVAIGVGAVNHHKLCNGSGGSSAVDGGDGGSSGYSAGDFVAAGYMSHNNFCNSLVSRRRGFCALKSNDSMESIGLTSELDMHNQNQSVTSKATNCDSIPIGNAATVGNNNNNNNKNRNNSNDSNTNNNNKFAILSTACELTPSPSDSGISELEAALKDRDSELSYLRQTMEHNEKVIFKVQKDKEAYWENETKRLKHFYEGQQREYLLKFRKMEQMLALQQFQLKQHKLRHAEQVNKLREQVADLKNELEILRNSNNSLKNSEHNLKNTVAYMDKQIVDAHNALATLRKQLEDSEWKVCERNGEIALLKTQLKEANIEITMKDHAIVNLKHDNTNMVESSQQMYQNLKQDQLLANQNQPRQQQQQQVAEKQQQQQQQQQQQLGKIIMLKDQVIVALTNELSKLRKELSDLAISHEYGEEPCGRYTRLKQQLDNLNEICQKTRKYTNVAAADVCCKAKDSNLNLDAYMQRLCLNNNSNVATMTTMQQQQQQQSKSDMQNLLNKLESSTLDTLIEESTTYAEDIAKLRQKLDDFRINLELEKRQWCAEKEKVLNYQKQLQAHYIHMYQRLRCLDVSSNGIGGGGDGSIGNIESEASNNVS